MTEERCGICKFSLNLRFDSMVCRRYPPVPIFHEGFARDKSEFPKTEQYSWCGEFKRKEVE